MILEPTDFEIIEDEDETGEGTGEYEKRWHGPEFSDNVHEMLKDLGEKGYSFREGSDEWKDFAYRWFEHRLKEIKTNLKTLKKVGGKFLVYRCIAIDIEQTAEDWLNSSEGRYGVGIYWSWDKKTHCAWGHDETKPYKSNEVVVVALIDPDDIDLEATAIQNLHPWSHSEKEIRLEEGAEIEIKKVFYKKRKQLKLGWSGDHEAAASFNNSLLFSALRSLIK